MNRKTFLKSLLVLPAAALGCGSEITRWSMYRNYPFGIREPKRVLSYNIKNDDKSDNWRLDHILQYSNTNKYVWITKEKNAELIKMWKIEGRPLEECVIYVGPIRGAGAEHLIIDEFLKL